MNRDNIPQVALTDFLYTKASNMRIPLSGTFELSPVCNFACRMCYIRKTPMEVAASNRGILTMNDWLRIARQAREGGMLYLLLTGGEPLLWPDFWTLYDQLVDMGFLVSINTNGSLIDQEAVDHFRRKPPRKLNITLYGAGDESYRSLCGVKGVFTKVDWAVRALKAAGIPMKLNCSLTPRNANDLEWIVDYAKKQGQVLAVTTYMFPPIRRDPGLTGVNERFAPEASADYLMRYLQLDRDEKAYKKILQGILEGAVEPPGLDEGCVDPLDGKIRCRAGKATFWVTWDGWLLSCGLLPEPRVDLKKLDFASAWSVLIEKAANVRLSGVCDKCPSKKVCHPCAAIAYAETGTTTGIPVYMCRTTRQMYAIARQTRESGEEG